MTRRRRFPSHLTYENIDPLIEALHEPVHLVLLVADGFKFKTVGGIHARRLPRPAG